MVLKLTPCSEFQKLAGTPKQEVSWCLVNRSEKLKEVAGVMVWRKSGGFENVKIGGLAEWSKAVDLRSTGRFPREFEPRILHFCCFCCQIYFKVVLNKKLNSIN